MDQVKIGKFIAELRKERNMTQTNLADKLGISFKTISKWETGRGMPELSLLKPLSEELGISINELLSGERIEEEDYIYRLEENMINTIDYSDKEISKNNNLIGILLLAFGVLIVITAITIFPSESSWGSFYSVFGSIISLVGVSRLVKKFSYHKRIMINFGFYILFIAFLFLIDFANVKLNSEAPRFRLDTLIRDTTIIYETPFYNVYRFDFDTDNERFVIDKHISIEDIDYDEFIK